MSDLLQGLLVRLESAPAWAIYGVLGIAAALENLLPPIPADVVVLFGGLLAGRGAASVGITFLAVWLCNVGGALLVYAIGRRYGAGFFSGRWGQLILRPRQLQHLNAFYRRFGFGVILISRFLPMFRAVVPVFAGIAGIGFWRTALPMAIASAAWYGALVYLGAIAGRNWEQIVGAVNSTGRWLWLLALVVAAGVGWWWWKSRGEEE